MVPIQYGSKARWYIRRDADPTLTHEAITLPRLGFTQIGIQYDATRKLNSVKRLSGIDSTNDASFKTVFQPVPYRLSVELYLWAQTMTDGLQIVEQIVPFFRPSFTVTMKELSDPAITRDVLITLEGVTHTDNAEGVFDDLRMLEWTFNFNLETNFYGPVSDTGIIKEVIVNSYIGADGQLLKLTGTPNPSDAQADEEWAFDEVWEDFPILE